MASGYKECLINGLERAVSEDMNRSQKFKGADIAELFRYLLNVTAQDDLESGGVVQEFFSADNPVKAEIIGGFLVRPQLGSFDILVDPGVLFTIAPDSADDDSIYKFVHDTGVSVPGTLRLPANNTPSVRVDVIEVQISFPISEVDDRFIFNLHLGQFVKRTVNKAFQGVTGFSFEQSNARVRTGIPGQGFPGTESGWLPLCVAVHAAGSVSNDNVTFYDVRPLISDRIYQPFSLTKDNPKLSGHIDGRDPDNVTGRCYAEINGRRVGGILRSTFPGTSVALLHLQSAANGTFWSDDVASQASESMLTFAVFHGIQMQTLWYMYLAFPFGLPRWARYTDVSFGSRVPHSPRGLLICTNTMCDYAGRPSTPIKIPSSYGFVRNFQNQTVTDAISIAAVPRRFAAMSNGCPWWMVNDYVGWGSPQNTATESFGAAEDTQADVIFSFGINGKTSGGSAIPDTTDPSLVSFVSRFPNNAISLQFTKVLFLEDTTAAATTWEFFYTISSDNVAPQVIKTRSSIAIPLTPLSTLNRFHDAVLTGDIEMLVPPSAGEGSNPDSGGPGCFLQVDTHAYSGASFNPIVGQGFTLVTGYRVSNW